MQSNPKAKFITRVLQFGSEPLFDWALEPAELAEQVEAAKLTLANLEIPVTISEMAYGFQEHDGAPDVLAAIDVIDAHILPFFASNASTGGCAVDSTISRGQPIPLQVTRLGRTFRMTLIGSFNGPKGGRFGLAR